LAAAIFPFPKQFITTYFPIMKKASLMLALALLCSFAAMAQMRVPAPSPAASVSQVVGATKISIDYSSPAVNGRAVWGGLVPYGKIWRAGANGATSISFQDDVTVGGKALKAGTYSLFITPMESGDWKVFFDPSGKSVFSYNEDEAAVTAAEGVVMTMAAPKMHDAKRERLTYYIDLIDEGTAHVIMRWDSAELAIEVKVDAKAVAQKSIEGQLSNWYTYASAADYYASNGLDLGKAQSWAEMSVKLQDHFFNKWVMANVMAKKGDKKEALKYAQEAQAFGEKNPSNWYSAYKDKIAAAIAEWK
jgi:hypothetical protein